MRTLALLSFLVAALPLFVRDANAWPPGDTQGIAVQFQNLTRSYNVHVPASYNGSTAVPLVLDFHGYTNDASTQESLSGFSTLSETVGFIVAYPEGYEGTGSARSWNVGICCPPATTDGIDDVGFAKAVVADIESKANIDPLRIYATGLSNGGGMSHRIACDAADVFAAAAPVSCPLLLQPFTLCQPIRPISVLHFAGLTDQVVPYNGGPVGIIPNLSNLIVPSSPSSFAYWVGTDSCGSGPPELVEDFGDGASCDTHTACSAGVEVGLCSLNGTAFYGHLIYTNAENVNIAQQAWTFMSQFTLPPQFVTTTTSTTTTSTTTTTLAPPCSSAPATGCQPALSQKAVLKLGKGATPDKAKIGWKWISSGTVVPGDFGDPTAATNYVLCLYDHTGLVMTLTAPAGGTCAGKPCWTVGSSGAKYTNKALVPDGLRNISLKAGGAGHGKIGVKGKGANLPAPTLPLTTPVRVQLRRQDSGGCWEATYTSALSNTPTLFKGDSD